MSFIVQLVGGIASAIQQYQGLERTRSMMAAQGVQALQESQSAQAEIQHRGNLIQGAGIARAGASGGEDKSTLDVLVDNAQQIGLDLARARYRGEMGYWAGQEGAKEAKFAQRMTLVMGPFAAGGALAQGAEKYGKYFQSSAKQPEATKEMWFSSATSPDWGGNTGETYAASSSSGLGEQTASSGGSWTDF